jgi:hypothetical protein
MNRHALRPLFGTFAFAFALACVHEGPLWVRKGFDVHADPTEAGMSAVGHAGGENQVKMDPTTRRIAAETASKKELIRRTAKLIPDECQKVVASAIMYGPVTDHWIGDKGDEYALTEISQGKLWEVCPAALSRESPGIDER